MKTAHTPGPWKIKPVHNATTDVTENFISAKVEGRTEIICMMVEKHAEADTTLIMAAPDLLESLKVLRELIRAGVKPSLSDLEAADAAIRKAEGSL